MAKKKEKITLIEYIRSFVVLVITFTVFCGMVGLGIGAMVTVIRWIV